uniref:ATP-dependent DNA helicase n=1 Tax=Panagrolaimus sp. ES5 TaxID=591445 RepID=A0AC34GQH6_9BILA
MVSPLTPSQRAAKTAAQKEARRKKKKEYEESEEGKRAAAEKADASKKKAEERQKRQNAKRKLKNIVIADDSDVSQMSTPRYNLRSDAVTSEDESEESVMTSEGSASFISLTQSQLSSRHTSQQSALSTPSQQSFFSISTPGSSQPAATPKPTPVNSQRRMSQSSTLRMRNCRARKEQQKEDVSHEIAALQAHDFHVVVAEEKLQKLFIELERYCFDADFLQPVTESPNMLRHKQLFRLRFHRRGNDPENDASYKHYKMRDVYPRLVDNFLNGNYPDLVVNTALSQGDVINYDGIFAKEYDDIDSTVMEDVYIRLCDPIQCPILTEQNVLGYNEVLVNVLCQLKDTNYDLAYNIISDVHENLRNLTLMDFLRVFYDCYAGIRTSYNKFKLIMRCLDVLRASTPVPYADLPTFIKCAVCKSMEKETVPADMTSVQVFRRFATEYQVFHEKEADLEVNVCEMCARLTCKKYLSTIQVNFDREWIPAAYRDNQCVLVCKQCKEDIYAEKIPRFGLMNGFHIDPTPDCFKKLNFLEKNLLQLVHPIIGEYSVTDHRGVGTGMRGKKGTATFHNVPLDATTGIVAKTLPDASSSKIVIVAENQTFQPTLIDLENVVECLLYLKDTNEFYKDITIDRQFQFANNALQVNPNYNISASDKDESLLTPGDTYVTGTTMRQFGPVVRKESVALTNYQKYVMRQHKYDPLKYDHKDLDSKSVPWLLPTGRFGWDFKREGDISFTLYNRARMRNENRQFATDPLYLLCVAGIIEQQQLQSSISIALRQSKAKFTCGEVLALIKSNKFEDHVLFSSMLSDLRGYAPYWANVKKLLRAHVQVFGSPTWWTTFNPDLKRWVKLHETYSLLTGKDVNETNIYEYVAKDPLIFQRFFHRRLRALWKFIHSDAKPIGEVIHSFKRIEYQLGGLDHAHCFFWIKGAPTKSSTPEEICNFIDKYVSVKRPDASEDPVLADIVEGCQMHDNPCRETCRREVVFDGKKLDVCRFEFPRETAGRTFLRSEFGSYSSKTRRLYSVARAPGEEHVNDYNAPLLIFWDSNMDIQFLIDGIPAVINYAVDYANKDEGFKNSLFEKKLHEEVQSKDLFQLGVDLMKRKKMPPTEALDIIMGENLYEFDAKHIFINLHAESDRKRIVVADKILQSMPSTSRAYCENPIDDYYPARPKELDNTSLFSFMIAFGIEYYAKGADGRTNTRVPAKNARGRRSDDFDFIEIDGSVMDDTYTKGVYYNSRYHPSDPSSPFYDYRHLPRGHVLKLSTGGKEIVKLARMLVPDIYLKAFKPGDAAEREDFYRRLCMLFIPWRNETSLKSFFAQQTCPYESRWVEYFEALEQTSAHAYNDIQRYLDYHLAYFEEERKMFEQRPRHGSSTKKDSTVDYTLNFDRGDIDENELEKKVKNLYNDQRTYFDHIMNNIDGDPFRIFLSGPGGNGKSTFLDVLDQAITLKYTPLAEDRKNTPAVVKCATTGAAAKNIDGFTIHALLGIEVDRFNLLSDNRLDVLRNQFSKIKLIMIDEISMASNELLAKISLRLQQITERDMWFGGISVLMVGDILQLPPVHGKFCFEVLHAATLKNLIECSADSYDMWNSMDIEYMELTENKRQAQDKTFGDILSRIRVGQATAEDVDRLRACIVENPEDLSKVEHAIQVYRDVSAVDKSVIVLFSTNEEVDDMNNTYLLKYFKDTLVVIYPLKYIDDKTEDPEDIDESDVTMIEAMSKRKFSRIYQESRYKLQRQPRKGSSHTKRKDKKHEDVQKLVIAPGVRVRLTKNLDMKKKLVNGSMGSVVSITYDQEDAAKVLEIVVLFDDIPGNISISRSTVTVEKPYAVSKRFKHFPLKVAFACTIHVTQGRTLSSAIISLERVFAPGQAYVALSRLSSVNGLYLLDCPHGVFYCDAAALDEQNKLRQSIGLSLYTTSVTFTKQAYPRVQNLPLRRVVAPSLRGNVTPPKTVNPKPVVAANPRTQHVFSQHEIDSLLLLLNLGNDCFLIATVNLLFFAEELRQSIIDNTNIQSDIQVQLVQILRRNIRNARSLRQSIPQIAVQPNVRAPQEAAGYALLLILNAIEDVSKILFMVNYHVFITCLCNNGERTWRNIISASSVTLNAAGAIDILNNMKDAWFHEENTACPQCHNIRNKDYELNISDEQRYLFVELNAYLQNNVRISEILYEDDDRDNFMFGVSWKLIGMVEHLGAQNAGHYKAWRRHGNRWLIADDNSIEEGVLPQNMSGFNVLLFERNV